MRRNFRVEDMLCKDPNFSVCGVGVALQSAVISFFHGRGVETDVIVRLWGADCRFALEKK